MHWRFDSYIVDSCDTINRCTGESLHPYRPQSMSWGVPKILKLVMRYVQWWGMYNFCIILIFWDVDKRCFSYADFDQFYMSNIVLWLTAWGRQNGCHFADDIFKCIFLNEYVWQTRISPAVHPSVNLFSNRIGSLSFHLILPKFVVNVHKNIAQKVVGVEFWFFASNFLMDL